MHEYTIIVSVSGEYTEEDLSSYLIHLLGFGSLSQDNPFIKEDSLTEITNIDLY